MADDDPLRSLWQSDDIAVEVNMERIEAAQARLRRQVRSARAREYVAAALVVPVAALFLGLAAHSGAWALVAGWGLMLLAIAFVVGIMWTHGEPPPAEPGHSLADFVEEHRAALIYHARLLEMAPVWYFAPFVPGFVVLLAASVPDPGEPATLFWVYSGIVVPAVFIGGVALNLFSAMRLRARARALARID